MIRLAVAEDRDVVVAMGLRFWNGSQFGLIGPMDAERMRGWFDVLLEHGLIAVAAGADGLVGVIALAVVEHPFTGERFGDELIWWVAPEHRAGSTGPRLLRYALRWAGQQGLHLVRMVAPAGPFGQSVRDYLEREGFIPMETSLILRLRDDGRILTVRGAGRDRLEGHGESA